eukprot:Skav206960  [mRNA]  locus=scaffold255:97287:103925:- [translate_table: standard]
MRRPAGAAPAVAVSIEDKWRAGEVVQGHRVPPALFHAGDKVIFEKSYYFGAAGKICGEVKKVEIHSGESHLLLKLLGTQSDGLITWATGDPSKVIRVHLCKPGCTQVEVAEDLAHGVELRLTHDLSKENGWASNLIPVEDARDDLAALRERHHQLEPEVEGVPGGATAPPEREESQRKRKRKEEIQKEKEEEEERQEEHFTNKQQLVSRGSFERKEGPDCQHQGHRTALWRHRAGPSGNSAEEGCQESKAVPSPQSEIKFQFGGELLRERREQRECRSHLGRRTFRGSIESSFGGRALPRHPRVSDFDYYEGSPPERDWNTRCGREPEGRELGLLPAGVASQMHRTSTTRTGDDSNGGGQPDGWQGVHSCGHPATTLQELREYHHRNTLVCEPAFRDTLAGERERDAAARVDGRPEGNLPRSEDSRSGLECGRPTRRRKRCHEVQRGPEHLPERRRKRSQTKRRRKSRCKAKAKRGLRGEDEEMRGRGTAPHDEEQEEEALLKTAGPNSGEDGTATRAVSQITSTAEEQRSPVALPAGQFSAATLEDDAAFLQGQLDSGHLAASKGGGIDEDTVPHSCPSDREKECASLLLQKGDLVNGGFFLFQRLLEVVPLCSQPTGKVEPKAVFPLPTSRSILIENFPELSESELCWLLCVCVSLNSFWGGDVFSERSLNPIRKNCLDGIVSDIKRFCSMSAPLENFNWDDFFKVKSIDYKGDEVQVARWFSWSNISPALPGEIGRVPLEAVCTKGCQHYVQNFDHYLKPRTEWVLVKPPKVMVKDDDWAEVCTGLVNSGLCTFLEESEVFDTGEGPLLNGLFGVSKDEISPAGDEVYRLIMNLIPLNSLCLSLSGDIETLPSWSGMSAYFLQPSENLLVSSEDVKCFFYTMAVPECWIKYLAFNKLVPDESLPSGLVGQRVYLASQVLPMGFLNSVSLAQHVHRNLSLASGESPDFAGVNAPEHEIRKDRPFCAGDNSWRIYLDNYDLLEKVRSTEMVDFVGTTAPGVLALRAEYEVWDIPRNVKKSVARAPKAEVQGATVEGKAGVAYPRESKLAKYFALAVSLCELRVATQKQWQVVCGGLVYFSMFRRPMLGSLNRVWAHIESFNHVDQRYQVTPETCKLEVLRFLGCLPLARLDFRLDMHPEVTCSDASTSGGGICRSLGLTPFGHMVAHGGLRGEIPETRHENLVLSVGLFDGIAALRVALETLGLQVLGHVSVEVNEDAHRVVETHFPGTVFVNNVEAVDEEMVRSWAVKFSQATVVMLGAGPPCQGVSGLNHDRRGALNDLRSCLFTHVPRVRGLLQRYFPWCAVHSLMESVSSMDPEDRAVMSESFGCEPWSCNAGCFTWCNRPRLYWVSWDLVAGDSVTLTPSHDQHPGTISLEGRQPLKEVVRSGWLKVDPSQPFPTFTTSRPQPAGIRSCTNRELEMWMQDLHRFPPYQYRETHCLVNQRNELRIPDVNERELMLGFPLNYTMNSVVKSLQKTVAHNDVRLTLLGNSWSVPVVSWLLGQLFGPLGFCPTPTPQDVLNSLRPGSAFSVQGRLVRLPLNPPQVCHPLASSYKLAFKLGNLISMKGEDLMISTPGDTLVRFQRLRATVPAKLWKFVEGRTDEERAKQRRKLGTLRDLTVQPATKKRYTSAVDTFLRFLKTEGKTLPRDKSLVDPLACEFLEHLWSSGGGRGQACDTLAGLQDAQPNLKGQLPGAWRLLRTWHVNEIPNRAPPLPEHLVQAMAGWAFFKEHYTFGISLLVGFYTMLRTGEVLGLRSSHMLSSPRERQVLISLGLTKGGKRQGAAESVILGYEPIVRLVQRWKSLAQPVTPLAVTAASWRKLFNSALEALHITEFGFRPYSLRRGLAQ